MLKIKLFITGLLLLMVSGVRAENDTVCFMYVSLRGDNAIKIYKLNLTTGVPEYKYTIAVNGGPASITIHPSKKFLYIAQRSINSISAFSIDTTTGALSLLNTITAVDNPVYIATDRSGNFLLTAYYAGNKAATYAINPNGTLNGTTIKTIDTGTGTNPHAILTDPSNRFMYLTNMTGNKIQQFNFDATTGMYTALSPAEIIPPLNTGPRHIAFGDSNILYTVNELGNSVSTYEYNKLTGTLTLLETLTTLPANFAGTNKSADIHITPNKKFLYASNRGHESIAVFSINSSSGKLTPIHFSKTVVSPREFEIDPTGKFLYAAGETNGDLSYYEIGTNGALDSINTITVGKTPSWVLITSYTQKTTEKKDLSLNEIPENLRCFPNPLHTKANFEYYLPYPSFVTLQIFNSTGKLITTLTNSYKNKGLHTITWDVKSEPHPQQGIFFCRLFAKNKLDTIKVIVTQ